jgi:hypothetical protein
MDNYISRCNNKNCKMARKCFRIHGAQGNIEINSNLCNIDNGFIWFKGFANKN